MVNLFLLNWNSVDTIKLRLKELEGINCKLRVIIINNDVEPLMNEYYFSKFKKHEIHIINNNLNLGYAAGNNSGLTYLNNKSLSGDIIISNPDVVLKENNIQELINARSLDSYGAIMTSAINEHGEKLYDIIKLNGFKQKWVKNITQKYFHETDYIAGSFFLISREAINKVGFFDEKYFLYWEEVDLSLRLKDLKFKLYSLPHVSVIRESNAIGRVVNAQYYLTRNSFLLKKKFPNYFTKLNHIEFLLIKLIVILKMSCQVKSIEPMRKYFKGLSDGRKY
ncbi:glycosyltransferase family 2 protein [Vibrio cyclitrophicus]|uniref:glycosyltransferase family 2 protein n=1 Tax=Vibrio cyclitrophicus TaxID=47951 RepID=UPI000C850681|nr:glycosyltransferase family 2 protein [Vibrio cyclitrophicus]PME22116.1 hypothetical protein BCV41_21410 [Vibrio cyclitrophicus]